MKRIIEMEMEEKKNKGRQTKKIVQIMTTTMIWDRKLEKQGKTRIEDRKRNVDEIVPKMDLHFRKGNPRLMTSMDQCF